MTGQLTILFSGMIAADPHQGGATWAVLQYLLGLRRLGHEVLFIEQCDESSLRPAGAPLERSDNASYFRSVMADTGLEQSSALLLSGSKVTAGVEYRRLRELAGEADALLTSSGTLTDQTLLEQIPVRVYLDLDPAFNQPWHEAGIDVRFDGHTHYATVGQAIGTPGCTTPTCGLSWTVTVPPVVLEHWPRATRVTDDAFTTVGNWRGYGSIEYKGVHYGQKAHSLRQFITLPKETKQTFLLAMAIHPDEKKDVASLAENGWLIVDPSEVTGTPAAYKRFIQGSKAEFGIAKSGYVESRCGGFSDRSACD